MSLRTEKKSSEKSPIGIENFSKEKKTSIINTQSKSNYNEFKINFFSISLNLKEKESTEKMLDHQETQLSDQLSESNPKGNNFNSKGEFFFSFCIQIYLI